MNRWNRNVLRGIKVGVILLVTAWMSGCRESQKEENPPVVSIVEEAQDSLTPLEDTIMAPEVAVQVDSTPDTLSLTLPAYPMAFDTFRYGMDKKTVTASARKNMKLGNYKYDMQYVFDHRDRLYQVVITSGSVQVIRYEADLDALYKNLYDVIAFKYDKPKGPRAMPSVFDVLNARTYWINRWEPDGKRIQLGLQEREMNALRVICKMTQPDLEKEEKEYQFRVKNKDKLEAAEKF
jgi:hypothetical protein